MVVLLLDQTKVKHSYNIYNSTVGDLPTKVPAKNGHTGTPIMGEAMLMNQFGRNGVIRKNIM